MIVDGRTPRVSIVTPFLNAARFISETIESVLAQTYDDWELVLVDDGSTDASSTIARDYARRHADRIHYLAHRDHANRGTCASRNAAVQSSSGEFIAFLDSDDVWLPHKLARQVSMLESQPHAAMVYGASQYWYSWTAAADDRVKDYVCDNGLEPDTLISPPELLVLLLGGTHTPCPSDILVRRSAVDAAGGFEESFTGARQLYEDQAFLAKVYLRESVLVSTECWDRYRIHPDSCDSVVGRSGREPEVRLFFLQWLEAYLARQGHSDEAVIGALQSALQSHALDSSAESGEMVRFMGWWLRTDAGATARLEHLNESDLGIDVRIVDAGRGPSFNVQLNQSRLRIEQGQMYELSGRVRAEAAGTLFVGVARSYPPWDSLGLYLQIDPGSEWHSFEARFVATGSATNARIHFDLAEAGNNVALDQVTLQTIPDRRRVVPDVPPPATRRTASERDAARTISD